MIDSIIDAIIDTIKIYPYLFITFLILELIEHKLNKKKQEKLLKGKKYGPLVGGLLGALPQCGFSSMASNLFSAKVITMGTLISIFLSTSDEMLPIMISNQMNIYLIIKIIIFKIIVGILIGFLIDLLFNKKYNNSVEMINDICEHDHCECKKDGILLSSVKHSLKTTLFIFIVNIIINFVVLFIGKENISDILLQSRIISYFTSSLIGLIPNCAGSIIITELYILNFISIGTMLSGLLTGSGLGILLLFKSNNNIKENLIILLIIYFIGVIFGLLVDLII